MAGRKPIPTALKLITGRKGRGINKFEPQPVKRMPDPPVTLSLRAKSKWNEIAPMLMRMGVLTEADGLGLAVLCEAYSDYTEARATLKSEGWYYQTENAAGGIMWRAHPAVGVIQDSDRRIRAWLTEHGMTSASRARLKVEPNQRDEDPAEAYFN